MNENKLTNDILDLHKQSTNRGIIYAIFHKDISIFSPKHIMSNEDRDEFLKFLLSSSEFIGKIQNFSDIWKTLIINPKEHSFYRFNLSDSYIEMTTVKMSEIIKTPL